MAGSEWPLEIEGREYHPVPETWIEHGFDDGEGDPRVYAVSCAVRARKKLSVRYLHPRMPKVLRVEMQGTENSTSDGVVPSMLATYEKWPRSTTPQGVGPTDVARELEFDRLRTLWGERVEEIPADSDDIEVLADGGRAVNHVFDLEQTHLDTPPGCGGDQR